jgi:hypothetical protein
MQTNVTKIAENPLVAKSETAEIATAKRKTPYLSPTLKVFGSVQVLTGSGAGSGTDGGTTPGMTKVSDLRYKENIVRIGTHPLGFGLYLFNYKPEFCPAYGATGRKFGVMAQEVETVMPAAVSIAANGYKQVDYAMLGVLPVLH